MIEEIAKEEGSSRVVDVRLVEMDDYDPENAVPAPSCWPLFCAVAKRLKAAEIEYRAAQQAYGEAVKQLSEEAVK